MFKLKTLFSIVFLGIAVGVGIYLYGKFGVADGGGQRAEPKVVKKTVAPIEKPRREYWEKPGFDWSKYKRIMIDVVTVSGDESILSMRDQQMLGNYFENAMKNSVQQKYPLVANPGPDVLRVQTAITGFTSADGSADKGSVTMSGKLMDSMSGEELITFKDSKSGALFSNTAIWGDITKGFDNWAFQLFSVLSNKLGHVTIAAKPVEDPMSARQQALLLQAERDIIENRLTTPAGNSALDRYREILSTSPKNKDGLDGLVKVVKKYVAWGERALRRGEVSSAEIYLDKARDILHDHEAVLRLEAALRQVPMQIAGGQSVPVMARPVAVARPAAAPKTVSKPAPSAPAAKKPPKAAPAPAAQATAAPAAPAPAAPAPVVQPAEFDPWKNAPGTGSASFSGGKLRPFMLGLETTGDPQKIVAAAQKRLKKAGFEIAGSYSPYAGATVIGITSATLKSVAAKSEFGGYGAAIRVAVVQAGEVVQVSYTNPVYMSNVYRMKGDLSAVAEKLGQALGKERIFGSNDGIAGDDLREWHYMFGMPYFDDHDEVGSGGDYKSTIAKVEAGLAAGKGGTKKVYRVDVPGKEETIFGVGISQGDGADATVMTSIDTTADKHVAHLPYEILVSGGNAYALNGKFRIALSFPDLTMGQFGSISAAPGAIEGALTAVAE